MSAASNLVGERLTIGSYYSLIRGQIEHEDNLMGTRLNWFITSQSFFFSAYAIVVTSLFAAPPPAGSEVFDGRQLLRILIPLVAITASALILFAITAGVLAMHNLRALFNRHAATADLFEIPPIQGFRRTWAMGHAAPVLLPLVFLTVWTFLLLHNPHVKHMHTGATTQHSLNAPE